MKATVEQVTVVSVSVKHENSKGCSGLAGDRVPADRSYMQGLQLNIH